MRWIAWYLLFSCIAACRQTEQLPDEPNPVSSGIEAGNLFLEKRQYDSALTVFSDLFRHIQQSPDTIQPDYAWSAFGLGTAYAHKNDYVHAIDYFQKALAVFTTLQLPEGQSKALNGLGVSYYSLREWEQALRYFDQSLALKRSLRDTTGMAKTLNNIGNIWGETGNLPKAIHYYREAATLREAFTGTEAAERSSSYYNLAFTYWEKGLADSARIMADQAYRLDLAHDHREGIFQCLNLLSAIYLDLGQKDKAVQLALEALSAAKALGIPEQLQIANDDLAALYESEGKWREALSLFKEARSIEREVSGQKAKETAEQLRETFQATQREQQIALLETRSQLQQRQGKQNKWAIAALLSGAAFLCVFLYIFYRQKQAEKKTNQVLANSNNLKTRLFAIISHDLKGPLAGFQYLTKALSQIGNNLEKEQLAQHLGNLYESAQSLNHVLNNLLLWSKSQLEGPRLQQGRTFTAGEMMEQLQQQLTVFCRQYETSLNISGPPPDTVIPYDADQMLMILRNLCSNALKFSPAGKACHLEISPGKNGWQFRVHDQGMGIHPDELPFLFDWNRRPSPVKDRSGAGLGLPLTYDVVQQMGGTLNVESQTDRGTIFHLHIPVGHA